MQRWLNQRNDGRDERGSVLILVIVVIVLLVLIGTAYLQVAIVQRQAVSIPKGNIEAVKAATISMIALQLLEDLRNNGEMYDYPWTDLNGTLGEGEKLLGGSIRNNLPANPEKDDSWLASITSVNHGGGGAFWQKISNMNQVFLRSNNSSDLTLTQEPTEEYVNVDGTATDMNIAVNSPLLVDSSGDGYGDSRWAWAPLPLIDGIAYTMAVRITDLGGRIDVNTATRLTGDGVLPGSTLVTRPRGFFPTDLDASRAIARTAAYTGPNTWKTEINNLLSHRNLTVGANNATPFGMGDPLQYPNNVNGRSRAGAWVNNVSHYGRFDGDPYKKLTIADELELRWRGGLNNYFYLTQIEQLMPVAMRANQDEAKFIYTNFGTRSPWMQGGTDTTPIKARQFVDIRKMLTVSSGRSVYASNPSGIQSILKPGYDPLAGDLPLRYDLKWGDFNWATGKYKSNVANGVHTDDRVAHLENLIKTVFKLDTSSEADNYRGKTNADIDLFAKDFAVMIQDYSDEDNVPTPIRVGGQNHYGMERLPLLREVYVQARYIDHDYWNADLPLAAAPGPGPDFISDVWLAQDGSQCMAIEIGNPFDHPIRTDEITDKIQVVVMQAGAVVASHIIVAADADGGALQQMAPRDHLIVYSNPGSTANNEGGSGNVLDTELQMGAKVYHAGAGVLKFNTKEGDLDETSDPDPQFANAAADDIEVELRVLTAGPDGNPGNGDDVWVAYDRITVDGTHVPGFLKSTTNPWVADTYRHCQASVQRDGQGSRYVTNNNLQANRFNRTPESHGTYLDGSDAANTNWAETLGSDYKEFDHPQAIQLDAFQLAVANRPIFSVSELGLIPTFAFTDNTTFTELFDDTATIPVNERFLDFNSIWGPTQTPAGPGIPHAALLMDQCTVLHPGNDGVDNITGLASTTPNDEEVFVGGIPNINTLPLHTAALLAGLPESMDDIAALMRAILSYRDNPADRDNLTNGINHARTEPGIASISELLMVNPSNPQSDFVVSGESPTPIGNAHHMLRYGTDGGSQHNTLVNLYPLPELGLPRMDHPDSAEEKLARFQFLGNTFTTRSDRFVAHVLIQGYRADDFRNDGDGPMQALRFVAIFDRSAAGIAGEPVRVLGVQDVE